MSKTQTLGHFLLTEMRKRGMSAREFADFVGVTHTIINKFLNHGISDTYSGRQVGDPSIDFLAKLSTATNTDICSLILLVKPDAFRSSPNEEDLLLSRQIGQSPPAIRDAIDAMILGLAINGSKNGDD